MFSWAVDSNIEYVYVRSLLHRHTSVRRTVFAHTSMSRQPHSYLFRCSGCTDTAVGPKLTAACPRMQTVYTAAAASQKARMGQPAGWCVDNICASHTGKDSYSHGCLLTYSSVNEPSEPYCELSRVYWSYIIKTAFFGLHKSLNLQYIPSYICTFSHVDPARNPIQVWAAMQPTRGYR